MSLGSLPKHLLLVGQIPDKILQELVSPPIRTNRHGLFPHQQKCFVFVVRDSRRRQRKSRHRTKTLARLPAPLAERKPETEKKTIIRNGGKFLLAVACDGLGHHHHLLQVR